MIYLGKSHSLSALSLHHCCFEQIHMSLTEGKTKPFASRETVLIQ